MCEGALRIPEIASREIDSEFRDQRDFVFARLRGNPSQEELKDLTDLLARISGASGQMLPLRALVPTMEVRATRDAAAYEEIPNDPDVMAQSLSEICSCIPQQGGSLQGIATARRPM